MIYAVIMAGGKGVRLWPQSENRSETIMGTLGWAQVCFRILSIAVVPLIELNMFW